MKFSYSWLKEYVDLRNIPPQKLAELLNAHAFEVESIEQAGEQYRQIYVAKIIAWRQHPNADRLRLVRISLGSGDAALRKLFGKKRIVIDPVVCGAQNFKVGDKVVFALPGSTVRDQHDSRGAYTTLTPTSIRGIESRGMLCSEFELGLGENKSGILVLPSSIREGTAFAKALGLQDTLLTVAIPSNRPDALGYWWMAREIAALAGRTFRAKPETYRQLAATDTARRKAALSVSLRDPHACPRYIGVLLEGVEVKPSPEFISKRLRNVGMRPINNVVDITNYVMLETGQPLHAFDAAKSGTTIVVRKARKGERIGLLDETEKLLDASMLVIADRRKPIAIAGIMGGFVSGISGKTCTVILEAAHFHPLSVRKTARKLGLRTDAALRFEKNLSPHMPEVAAGRAVELLRRYAGGRVVAFRDAQAGVKFLAERAVDFRLSHARELLGIDIPERRAKRILHSLGLRHEPNKDRLITPFWRSDIQLAEDIVEELGRVYGYDKIPQTFSTIPFRPEKRELSTEARTHIRTRMQNSGFNEVQNYSYYSVSDGEHLGFSEASHLALENPLSSEQALLRRTLVPGLLKNLRLNQRQFDHIKLFEIGRTYFARGGKVSEVDHLAALSAGKLSDPSILFRELKGALSYAGFSDEHVAASLTMLSPELAAAYGVDVAAAYAELPLASLPPESLKRVFRGLPRYPSVIRDFSVVIDRKTAWTRVENAVRGVDRKLIKMVELFDRYEGKGIGEGKKSLAFHVIFRADDRTLREEEVTPACEKIAEVLAERFGAEIRA